MNTKAEIISQLAALEAVKTKAENGVLRGMRMITVLFDGVVTDHKCWEDADREQNRLIAELGVKAISSKFPPPPVVLNFPAPAPTPAAPPDPELAAKLERLRARQDYLKKLTEEMSVWRSKALDIITATPGVHYRAIAKALDTDPDQTYSRLYKMRGVSITLENGRLALIDKMKPTDPPELAPAASKRQSSLESLIDEIL